MMSFDEIRIAIGCHEIKVADLAEQTSMRMSEESFGGQHQLPISLALAVRTYFDVAFGSIEFGINGPSFIRAIIDQRSIRFLRKGKLDHRDDV